MQTKNNKKAKMKMDITPLSELTDEIFGKIGTPKRDAMEKKLQEEVNLYLVGEAIRKIRRGKNVVL